jgi:transposase
MPWTGRAYAGSCSKRRPRRATSCFCSRTRPKRSPIRTWRTSGPREGPTCAFQPRVRVPAPGPSAKVAMLGVLDWARRELIVHTSRTKRSADFIALLEEIDRRYGPKLGVAIQPLVLVLDNGPIHTGPIHTSKMSRAALAARAHWLTLEGLPKSAPELNDIEGGWRDLKRHHLAHQTFTGPDDLDCAIHDAVRKLNTERSRQPLANHRSAA